MIRCESLSKVDVKLIDDDSESKSDSLSINSVDGSDWFIHFNSCGRFGGSVGCLSIQDRVQFAGEIIVEITVNG